MDHLRHSHRLTHAVFFAFVIFVLANAVTLGFAKTGDKTTKKKNQSTRSPKAIMPHKHAAIFQKYCLDCHNSETKEGKTDLESIPFDIAKDIPTAERWQKVLNVINSGEMPPEDSQQLSNKDKTNFLSDLSNQLVVARDILSDSGGVITIRRLNRREYQNSLESLLGVRPNVSSLPDDSGAGGFDTTGASLFISSDQFEQYLAVARKALKATLVIKKKHEPRTIRIEPEEALAKTISRRARSLQAEYDRAQARRANPDKSAGDFGFIDDARGQTAVAFYKQKHAVLDDYLKRPETKTGAALIISFNGAESISTPSFNNSTGGKYTLRMRLGAYKDAPESKRFIEYGAKLEKTKTGEMLVTGHAKVIGTVENPEIMEIPLELPPGFNGKVLIRQRISNSRKSARDLYLAAKSKNRIGPPPAVWVDWVELKGPYHEQWPTKAYKEILFHRPKKMTENAYVKEVIRRFASRAFRIKQPSESYLKKLMERYQTQRKSGKTLREAVVDPLSIVLASPSFLYMSEPTGGKKRALLSDEELAVRLSYFLWSAPPDEELLSLAKQKKLSQPTVLKEQVDRLLADERSNQFVDGFAHQWLDMERLDMFQFESAVYPEWDETIRANAREEVYQTIRTVLLEGLPLGTLLKSDFVVVNDILADYYRIEGVNGTEFRKVSVPSNSPRGGLLGMIAIHAMGSDGFRSSPVERGAWVLRYLLDDPPPPAPANVPQLSRLSGKQLPARKLQQAHMEEPQCAQCHRDIDPIGYGLENFDASGKWRDQEAIVTLLRKGRTKKKLFPIDPKGQLPDGTKFNDYFELRDAISKYDDAFARGFTKALIAYGLGRPYGFTDHNLRNQILKKAKFKNYQMSEFIYALVQSKQFRTK